MHFKLKTPPAALAVSLAEAKSHCRIDHDDDDAALLTYIASAIASLDGRTGFLGIALLQQTWELYLDAFPAGPVTIDLPPIISIDEIAYVTPSGTAYSVLSSSAYATGTNGRYGVASPVTTWPATKATLNAVRITFKAGFGSLPADVPADIRGHILNRVSSLYDGREVDTALTGDASELRNYREWAF